VYRRRFFVGQRQCQTKEKNDEEAKKEQTKGLTEKKILVGWQRIAEFQNKGCQKVEIVCGRDLFFSLFFCLFLNSINMSAHGFWGKLELIVMKL
jgi:hypothetical protein